MEVCDRCKHKKICLGAGTGKTGCADFDKEQDETKKRKSTKKVLPDDYFCDGQITIGEFLKDGL